MIYSSKCSLCSTVSEHISCILIIFSSRWPEVKKFSKAAHSFKFRTLLIFSIIQPLKSSLILRCTHVFQRIHHWEVFGKVWCPQDLCRKWSAISKLTIILNRQTAFHTLAEDYIIGKSSSLNYHPFLLLLLLLLLLAGRKSPLHQFHHLSHLPSLIL